LNHVRGREDDRAGSGIGDGADGRIDLCLIAEPVDHHIGTGCGEHCRYAEADAARRAGNDRRSAVERIDLTLPSLSRGALR
jgi:hypothetical protein